MKKANVVLLVLATAGLLAACGGPGSSESEPIESPSSSVETPSSTEPVETTTEPTPSTSIEDPIEHQAPYTKDLAEGTIERAYDDKFDLMHDDFSGETTNGVASEINAPTLRVLVDSANGDFPSTADASIYKTARDGGFASFDGIGFRMRVASGKVSLANLALKLRCANDKDLYTLKLAEAKNPDGEDLPELTGEYQDIVISPNMSIDDENTVYEGTDLKVLESIIGFHLVALEGEVSGELEITKVFTTKGADIGKVDDFDRDAVNKANGECYWRDSTGVLLRKGAKLGSYSTPTTADLSSYTHLVLDVAGDSSGAKIAPITDAGVGTYVEWANLKASEGVALSPAATGAYHPIAIDLVASGIALDGVKGYSIVSSTGLYVSAVYSSSLKEVVAAGYPTLAMAGAKMADSFSTAQSSFTADWDAACADPIFADNEELVTRLAYAGADKISIADGVLTLAAQSDYTNLTVVSKANGAAYDYAVFAVKLGEGASLNDFRVKFGSSDVSYANNWKAGAGLPSIPADPATYEYVQDGYMWLIVDKKATGVEFSDIMNIYYTGAGPLYIDKIFFADKRDGFYGASDLVAADADIDTGTGYIYQYGGYCTTGIFSFVASGDGTATLGSTRFEYNGTTVWVKDGLVLRYEDGSKVDTSAPIPAEATTYYLDLAENGYTVVEGENVHIHVGGIDGVTGTMHLVKTVDAKRGFLVRGDGGDVNVSNTGYVYYYGGYNTYGASKVSTTLHGDGKVTLMSFRIEVAGDKTVFLNNGLVILKDDGTQLLATDPIPEELHVTVDLAASGFGSYAGDMHWHFGGNADGVEGTLHIDPITASYDDVAPSYSLSVAF